MFSSSNAREKKKGEKIYISIGSYCRKHAWRYGQVGYYNVRDHSLLLLQYWCNGYSNFTFSREREQVVILCDCIIVSSTWDTRWCWVQYVDILLYMEGLRPHKRYYNILSLEKRKIRIYSWNNPKLALNGMSTRDILICCCWLVAMVVPNAPPMDAEVLTLGRYPYTCGAKLTAEASILATSRPTARVRSWNTR